MPSSQATPSSDGLRAVLINDTSVDHHHGCDAVIAAIRRGLDEVGISLLATVARRASWRQPEILQKVDAADLIVVNGEGSIHSARAWVREMLSIVDYALPRKIPIALINSVYHNNDGSIHALVSKYDLVAVRESRSARELKNNGVDARVVPDLIFRRIADSADDLGRDTRKYLRYVYTDSALPLISNRLHRLADAGARDAFLSLYTRSDPHSRTRSAIQKYCFSRHIGDVAVFGRRQTALHCHSIDDLIRLLHYSEGVITGRFHMVCMAMALGIPFVAVPSNSFKIEALLADAHLTGRLRAIDDINVDADLRSYDANDARLGLLFAGRARFAIAGLFRDLRALASLSLCPSTLMEPST